MQRLIEAGHYYATKGVTKYSDISKKICWNIKNNNDKTMLFVDDVHEIDEMFTEEATEKKLDWTYYVDSPGFISGDFILMEGCRPLPEHDEEKILYRELSRLFCPSNSFDSFQINTWHARDFDFTVMESALLKQTENILQVLFDSGKVKSSKNGTYFSGIKLFHQNGFPTCVMLDVALTIYKTELTQCKHVVNILPEFYLPQQENLKRVVSKILPDVKLDIILFTSEKEYRYL